MNFNLPFHDATTFGLFVSKNIKGRIFKKVRNEYSD